ncbi:MAG: hypothetical protein ACKO6N_24475 [Myxococcota bacterium]
MLRMSQLLGFSWVLVAVVGMGGCSQQPVAPAPAQPITDAVSVPLSASATDPNRVSPTTDYATFGACDPLVPQYCMFPWPNNFFMRVDASSNTGARMAYTEEGLPKDRTRSTIDPAEWNTLDGFTPMPAIFSYFPDVVLDNVPHHWDMIRSLEADSPTVIIDAETGEKLLHFAELDESGAQGQPKAFMMWPAARLKDGHRYIVAIRDLKNRLGETIAPSDAFRALRDNTPTSSGDIEGRRAVYADIFSRLTAAGIDRSSLQLAWDFTTASQENLTGRLVAARDDAFTRVPANGPDYRIKSVQNFTTTENSTIGRQISLDYKVPYYTDRPGPGSVLVLDAEGKPVFQGWTWVPGTVRIPHTLLTNPRGGRLLQYGHGLLGGQGEVESGYLGEIANRYGYVLFATDWWGMCSLDSVNIVLMLLTDISDFRIIPDRSTQGMVNFLLMMKLMSGRFAQDSNMVVNGVSMIDGTKRSYFGNSQGGILGGVYMAVSTDVERGILGVPGAPYPLLLPRSVDFTPFFMILKGRYTESLDQIFLLSLMGQLWDRAEPSGYLNAISDELLPNTPEHRVIFHYGLGDAQVSYLGAEMMARSVGAAIHNPYASEGGAILYGLDDLNSTDVVEQSVLVPYYFGVPEAPVINNPPDSNYDTHEKPRRERTAQDQMNHFFETGQVKAFCDGACDPN